MLSTIKNINKCGECPSIIFKLRGSKDCFFGDDFDFHTKRFDLTNSLDAYLYYHKMGDFGISCGFADCDSEELKSSVELCKVSRHGTSSSSRGVKIVAIKDFVNLPEFFSLLKYFVIEEASDKLTIHQISFNLDGDTLSSVVSDTLEIDATGKLNKTPEELDTFLYGIILNSDKLASGLISFLFTKNKNKPGYMDIYEGLIAFMSSTNIRYKYYDTFRGASISGIISRDVFLCYAYLLEDDYYFIIEKMIKENRSQTILTYNPIFSGKPIPKLGDVKSLSNVSRQILDKLSNSWKDEGEQLLLAAEEDSKIGVNGIVLLKETLEALMTFTDKYKTNEDSWDSAVFSINRRDAEFNIIMALKSIVQFKDYFDFTMKDLCDRIIRALFYYNMKFSDYLQIICDYVEICKASSLPIPEKMPKEIIEGHNILKTRLDSIREGVSDFEFKKVMSMNEHNLINIPDSTKYTIISPEKPLDLINEGLYLNHCVGSYVDRYIKGYSKVYFVRNKDNTDIPFVTVELDKHDNLVQMSTFNDKLPAKEVCDFIVDWSNNL